MDGAVPVTAGISGVTALYASGGMDEKGVPPRKPRGGHVHGIVDNKKIMIEKMGQGKTGAGAALGCSFGKGCFARRHAIGIRQGETCRSASGGSGLNAPSSQSRYLHGQVHDLFGFLIGDDGLGLRACVGRPALYRRNLGFFHCLRSLRNLRCFPARRVYNTPSGLRCQILLLKKRNGIFAGLCG